tara:strand:+ start:267 stop:428 length:162 start_codon:yes stop_codon:yes gene_type:complete
MKHSEDGMAHMKKVNGIWELWLGDQCCWVTEDGMAHYDLKSAEKRKKQLLEKK